LPLEGVLAGLAWGALSSVCVAPFLFGAVDRAIWIPLCQLWLGLGLASSLIQARLGRGAGGIAASRALLPIHALFLVQLIPLPAWGLKVLSPGSFAAHFLPDPGDGRFRPLSVSPSATLEAWLYFAGLQGLFLTVRALPLPRRRAALQALLGVALLLAGEGLWQSRSAHPSWLYGRIPIAAPSGLETGGFGPYYNRNHFATVMAVGAAIAAGLAATALRERGPFRRLLSDTYGLAEVVVLSGAALFLTLTAAASGSRSGTLAAIVALVLVSARILGARRALLPLGLGLVALVVSGAASIERLLRANLLATRWIPWLDMTRLFPFFPIFGSGFGAFGATYWPYQTHSTFEYWQHAHNDYLQWAIEGGLAGVLLIAWAILRLARAFEFSPEARETALAAAAAFATQAAMDFPVRITANAGLLIATIALTTKLRSE
jgi:O-antigen ligase